MRRRRWQGPLLGALMLVAWPRSASAFDLRVRAQSVAEAYAIVAPRSGLSPLSRRRLVQYLQLEGSDLLPPKDATARRRDAQDGQLRMMMQLRLQHSFGQMREEASGLARTLLSLRESRQLDLLHAYLEGQQIARVLDFRVGRQLDPAQLDYFAMDGVSLGISPPGPARNLARLQLWGGFQVRSTSPLGALGMVLETPDQDAGRGDTAVQRGYLMGAALSSSPFPWLFARAGVRQAFAQTVRQEPQQVLPPDNASLSAFSHGVEQSLLFAQLSAYGWKRRLFLNASASYNLGLRGLSLGQIALTGVLAPGHRLKIGWLRSLPVLDLDSIFSVFDLGAFSSYRMRYTFTPNRRWQFSAQAQLRQRQDPQQSDASVRGGVGGLSAALSHRRHKAQLHAQVQAEPNAWQVSQLGRWDVALGQWPFRLGLLVHHAQSSAQARRQYAISAALTASMRLFSGISVRALVEELHTQDIAHSTRVFAALSLDANLRAGDR